MGMIALIVAIRGGAVAIHAMNGGSGKKRLQITGNHMTNGGIAGAGNITLIDAVVHGYVMAKQKGVPLGDGLRGRLVKEGRQQGPEAIQGVAVVEAVLAGFD